MKKIFLPLWILGAGLLFLYSYTQVDLSLTLSQASIFQVIQKSFQYVGWFNRPLSTLLYISVLSFLFIVYIFSIKLVLKKRLDRKTLWTTTIIVTVILTFSYNAFSYDLFNYIFDAKIVTYYQQNPYIHKALDFPGDPMLSFMHWTHRVYPYGPVWLLLTVPLSFTGGQIFIVTFFLFKIMISLFFLLATWSIEKIADKLNLSNPLLPIAAFGLNPYVLTESLVSSHNDIVMMGLAMFGVFLVLKGSNTYGWLAVIFSIGVKFATGFAAFGLFVLKILKKEKLFFKASIILMIIAVILATLRTTYQPWYFLYVLPFAVIEARHRYILVPLVLLSVGNLVLYIPYLYLGNWDPPVPQVLNFLVYSFSLLSIVISIFLFVKSRK